MAKEGWVQDPLLWVNRGVVPPTSSPCLCTTLVTLIMAFIPPPTQPLYEQLLFRYLHVLR